MRSSALAIAAVALGCKANLEQRALANYAYRDSVELAWHARIDERDWEHVTLVIDGTPYEVGVAGGPDDDGDTAPDGCTSEPDRANATIQLFYCGGASRWYSAALQAGEVVVTRFDQWYEPSRQTATVVRRVPVHGTRLHVLAYRRG